MIGITSLDLLAHAARLTDRLVAAVVDARRGEVFTALYRSVPGGVQQVSPPAVVRPEDLASELQARNEECVLVGDGAVRHRGVFADVDHARLGGRNSPTRPPPSSSAWPTPGRSASSSCHRESWPRCTCGTRTSRRAGRSAHEPPVNLRNCAGCGRPATRNGAISVMGDVA